MTFLKAFIGEVTLWYEIVVCLCLGVIGCFLAAATVLVLAWFGCGVHTLAYSAFGVCVAPLTIRFLIVTGRDLASAFKTGYKRGFRRD